MTSKIPLLLLFLILTATSGISKTTNKTPAFIRNIGQVTDQYGKARNDIDYKLQAAPGLNVFLGTGAIHYQWYSSNKADTFEPSESRSLTMYRMDIILIGANMDAFVTRKEILQTKGWARYYLTSVATSGNMAGTVTEVTYHNIYPFIDWTVYINKDGKIEHDFTIHPGGKVSDIRLRYDGASSLALRADGSIEAETPYGTINEAAPIAYKKATGENIACWYNLRDEELTYGTGDFKGALVIDPIVSWSTYFGGTDYDDIAALAHGSDGSFFIAGSTGSASNIATTGAFQFTIGGGNGLTGADAFLSKFSEDGTCLWSTYFGGAGTDLGRGIAIDTSGKVYLSGRTNSATGIATTGSYQAVKAGTTSGYDCFLIKFDSAGQRVWGTYFGGNGQDGSLQVSVSCDKANGVYLLGNTASMEQIATPGSYQPTFSGSQDAFLAKFSTDGSLAWSTYFGGTGLDVFQSAECDEVGNVVLAGYSSSPGLASPGAYQPIHGGAEDALLVKFNGEGQLQWATYLGGADQDRALSLKTKDHAIYIGGATSSTTGIASAGAYQASLGDPSGDGFLARFNTAGERIWSTYYGGSQSDVISGISAAEDGKIYVGGTTASSTGIATPNSIDTSLTGIYNCIVSCFDTAGGIHWGSYFGTLSDEGTALSAYGNKIVLAGKTLSSTGIGTPGGHQTMIGGDQDGFLVQINTCITPAAIDTVRGSRNICAGDTLILRALPAGGSGNYLWILPAGWTQISSGDTLIAIVGTSSAAVTVLPVNECSAGDTVTIPITVTPAPFPVISRNGNILATTQAFPSYQWNLNGMAIPGAANPTHIAAVNGSYTVTVTNASGCAGISPAVIVSDLTALHDPKEGITLPIYPNPADKIVYLKLPYKAELQIYDKLGRLIHKQHVAAGAQSLNLETLAAGMYLINAFDEKGNLIGSCKLVKE
ncbi:MULTISPECIES: T9SS type A sorting domain-containing protein [Sphingobacterium]|uniref:DUF7948 domain-containing protein n=1 Tax=Sphingobacterium TaxID=28453 RepID=UPI0008A37A85|nr:MULTISPECIES: T9SS type A sorting domain-containing protein [Sphingobacterium]OFV09596.1 hypothetical protein HMPREF3127_23320 [Sphingobacterium sp. HMSC13C05]